MYSPGLRTLDRSPSCSNQRSFVPRQRTCLVRSKLCSAKLTGQSFALPPSAGGKQAEPRYRAQGFDRFVQSEEFSLGQLAIKNIFAIQCFSSLELMSAILQSVKTLGMDRLRGTPYVHRRRKDFLVIIMILRGNGCILTGNRAGSLSTQCRTLHVVVHNVAIYWPWPTWQKAHR